MHRLLIFSNPEIVVLTVKISLSVCSKKVASFCHISRVSANKDFFYVFEHRFIAILISFLLTLLRSFALQLSNCTSFSSTFSPLIHFSSSISLTHSSFFLVLVQSLASDLALSLSARYFFAGALSTAPGVVISLWLASPGPSPSKATPGGRNRGGFSYEKACSGWLPSRLLYQPSFNPPFLVASPKR